MSGDPNNGGFIATRCPAWYEKDTSRRMSNANIPPRFASATVGDFSTSELPASFWKWIKEPGDKHSVWMSGGPGIGKSHLAAALVKRAVKEGANALWIDSVDWANSTRDRTAESKQHVVARTDVLVIDDLDKVRMTPWIQEQMWLLIKARCEEDLVTIVTSNKRAGEWADEHGAGPAIKSRFAAHYLPVSIDSNDRRMAKMARRERQ
tara:strand:- start:953 stop:1573 length:621 start_codon:yes stop_codon:yes gene_type:complete